MSIQTDSLKSSYNIHYANGERALKDGNKAYACEEFLSAAMAKKELANLSNGSEKDEHQKTAEMLLKMVEKLNYEIHAPKVIHKPEDDAQLPMPEKSTITFADVAGLDEVKRQVRLKVLAPLQKPETAKKYKIEPGVMILLYGPPGTGKTLVAHAIAGEVGAEFFYISCKDLISKYLGDSSQSLANYFKAARKYKKALLFFDDFELIAKQRSESSDGAESEIGRVVSTFLAETDGKKNNKGDNVLILLAATNIPWMLDTALLRGGRFSKHIYVGLPDREAREFLVNHALKDMPMTEDVDLNELAQSLDGYGGADITAICEEIRTMAYEREIATGESQKITKEDCEKGIASIHNMITPEMLARFEEFRLTGK